jgi:enterochelin esterase family protein
VPGQEADREATAKSALPSPRLSALATEVRSGNRGALEAFWSEAKGRTPLVEPLDGDETQRLVTFVWRGGEKTERVALFGGRPGGGDGVKEFSRLPGTDLWYRTERHPSDARFGYALVVNLPELLPESGEAWNQLLRRIPPQPDPLAARSVGGGSYAELPDAPPQSWITPRPDVPKGTLSRQSFKSRVLEAEYRINLYTPPGYDPKGQRCWLMIAFDGGFPDMEATLDNLRAAGKIPPIVVVGIENISRETRTRDLGASPRFARFLVEELVPWARKSYRVHTDPSHTIVAGISRGGLMAAYCGLMHWRVFGKVLSQAGAFENPPEKFAPQPIWLDPGSGWIIRQYVAQPRRPVEFYVEVGRYDTNLMLDRVGLNRRFRDVLEAKGYRVTYREYNGGHDPVCWRGSFADAVLALTGRSIARVPSQVHTKDPDPSRWPRAFRVRESRRYSVLNEWPQPQVETAWGLSTLKPAPIMVST